jgi:protein-S-isoprenylcysteine O-methyltransferase Ste14
VSHILSYVFIGGGFILLSSAWNVLYQAQSQHRLATMGPYARVRHPQYIAFIAIMFGFLLQWPTILTLAMFPVLVAMYVHLAHTEEKEVRQEFGTDYDHYAAEVPEWFPRLRGPRDHRHAVE